jgi:hypothetical protein
VVLSGRRFDKAKEFFLKKKQTVSTEARTLDLRANSSTFFVCAMWDNEIRLNFDNILTGLPVPAKKKCAGAGGRGKIGGTRLELGIAGRKKNAFYELPTTFLIKPSFFLKQPCPGTGPDEILTEFLKNENKNCRIAFSCKEKFRDVM